MIRLMSIVPLLSVGGSKGFGDQPLTSDGWREFATLTDEQRQILLEHHGTWLRVHPHDHDELKALGLDFKRDVEKRPSLQESLVDLRSKKATSPSTSSSSAPEPSTTQPVLPDGSKTDESGTTDPVTTIATETPADIGTAGKPTKRK